jgi:hypothetical protein
MVRKIDKLAKQQTFSANRSSYSKDMLSDLTHIMTPPDKGSPRMQMKKSRRNIAKAIKKDGYVANKDLKQAMNQTSANVIRPISPGVGVVPIIRQSNGLLFASRQSQAQIQSKLLHVNDLS